MNMNHPTLVFGLLLFSSAITNAQAAPTASTAQSGRIADVSVPYTVSISPTAIRFANKNANIIVTNDKIQAGNRTFQNPVVSNYYVALRSFLGNSSSMANTARAFLHNKSAFPQAATNMCQSILDVHASGSTLAQIFPDFSSPVQVVLR